MAKGSCGHTPLMACYKNPFLQQNVFGNKMFRAYYIYVEYKGLSNAPKEFYERLSTVLWGRGASLQQTGDVKGRAKITH